MVIHTILYGDTYILWISVVCLLVLNRSTPTSPFQPGCLSAHRQLLPVVRGALAILVSCHVLFLIRACRLQRSIWIKEVLAQTGQDMARQLLEPSYVQTLCQCSKVL